MKLVRDKGAVHDTHRQSNGLTRGLTPQLFPKQQSGSTPNELAEVCS